MWQHKTLEEMEQTASNEDDGFCCKRINKKWLDVRCSRWDTEITFTYKFDGKILNRNEAENVFYS